MTPLFWRLSFLSFSCHGDSRHAAHGIHCRQFLALADRDLLLACWAHGSGQGWQGAGFSMLFWSGVIGFGLGDLALYMALPRIGSRLTLLIVHCVAAPFAAVVEWYWLQTGLSTTQAGCIVLILAGVHSPCCPSAKGKRIDSTEHCRYPLWSGGSPGTGDGGGDEPRGL